MSVRKIALPALLLLIAGLGSCAVGAVGAALRGAEPILHKPEIELPATKLFGPVTNTMLASWVTMVVLVLVFLLATRRLQMVPGRFQALAETAVEMLLGLVESIVGKAKSRMVFPLVATIFLFVMFNAYLGLLPVYGPIGFKGHGGGLEAHLLRNPNTDINLPLAIAIISFLSIEMWGMRAIGAGTYLGQFFNFRALISARGFMGLFMGVIQFFVGLLEVLSHLIRLLSFTLRLFGNMTAGEILLLIISFLAPLVFPLPFYGLELLVGFVQALIFAGLTLVFAAIAMMPHGEEEHGGGH